MTDNVSPYNSHWEAAEAEGKTKPPRVSLYAIHAMRNRITEQGSINEQLPTFYLDPRVQGIISATHAEAIAHDILGNDHYYSVTAFPHYESVSI